MKKNPQSWTHHHTLRIYHTSLLVTFICIVLAVSTGMVSLLTSAQADEYSFPAQSVGVSATIAGIESGPTEPSSTPVGGGGYVTVPVPAPSVTIVPDAAFGSFATTSSGALFTFTTPQPKFSGTVSMPNALIYIGITGPQNLNSTTYSDKNLNWSWQSPLPLPKGVYTITVTVQDPDIPQNQATASLKFAIAFLSQPSVPAVPQPVPEPHSSQPSSRAVLNIFMKVLDQFKTIVPGSHLAAAIRIVSSQELKKPLSVVVQYTILDPRQKVILQTQDTLVVQQDAYYTKIFYTQPLLPAGTYTIIARLVNQPTDTIASDTFQIQGQGILSLSQNVTVDATVIFQALFVILFLFILIGYFEYTKVRVASARIKAAGDNDLKDSLR